MRQSGGRGSETIMRALMPFAVVLVLVSLAPGYGADQNAHWLDFHDPQTGLNFHYPPDLHIRRRDPKKFGLPNVETIIDLIGSTKLNPDAIVLRFLVKRGYTSSADRANRVRELHRVCDSTSSITVGGHKAVVCISRGSAAVHWSVKILDPRECTILTLLGGADYEQSLPPPHNGEFPLLSIIRTVHFAHASGLRVR